MMHTAGKIGTDLYDLPALPAVHHDGKSGRVIKGRVCKKEIIAHADRACVGMIATEHRIQVSCSVGRGLFTQNKTAPSVHYSERKASFHCISAKTSARDLHRYPSKR